MWSEDLPLSLSSDPASEYCGQYVHMCRSLACGGAAGKDQDFKAIMEGGKFWKIILVTKKLYIDIIHYSTSLSSYLLNPIRKLAQQIDYST